MLTVAGSVLNTVRPDVKIVYFLSLADFHQSAEKSPIPRPTSTILNSGGDTGPITKTEWRRHAKSQPYHYRH